MKTEYVFTEQQKKLMNDIDERIIELQVEAQRELNMYGYNPITERRINGIERQITHFIDIKAQIYIVTPIRVCLNTNEYERYKEISKVSND